MINEFKFKSKCCHGRVTVYTDVESASFYTCLECNKTCDIHRGSHSVIPHADFFLEDIKSSKKPVSIYLVNGIKLQGVITYYNNEIIVTDDKQLIYKHAIATIQTGNKNE